MPPTLGDLRAGRRGLVAQAGLALGLAEVVARALPSIGREFRALALVLPPLRTCRDDIPLLAEFFLARLAERMGAALHTLDADAMRVLLQHDWPGNVLESAVVMAQGDTITANERSANLLHCPVGPAMPTAGTNLARCHEHRNAAFDRDTRGDPEDALGRRERQGQ